MVQNLQVVFILMKVLHVSCIYPAEGACVQSTRSVWFIVLKVRVCNLLGQSLGKLTVTADTARHVGDDAVVLSKKPLTASAADQYDISPLLRFHTMQCIHVKLTLSTVDC